MKEPKTFLVGHTVPDQYAIQEYLDHTGQGEFSRDWWATKVEPSERMVSMFAKMCYKSLVPGNNKNVTKTRDINSNLRSVIDSGHGSVLEHSVFNFITTDCSRVFTHELVRHRAGTAFSQTSGRYVAIDEKLDIVFPDDLVDGPTKALIEGHISRTAELAQKLRGLLIDENTTFSDKKKITSAIRRIAPNGQDNEIAWSANWRALRHMIEMRTSRHAEWEIRLVFNQVADLIKDRFPMSLYGSSCQVVDGLKEYTNLKV